MKEGRHLLLVLTAVFWLMNSGCDSVKIYGPVDSRPEEKVGTWVVGGRSMTVTDVTELEEEHGPLVIGACAEVELEGIVVTEIESQEASKCRQ